MSKPFLLKIVTPVKVFFEDEVEALTAPTESGSRGFLADAEAAVYILKAGTIRFTQNKKQSEAETTGGFIHTGRFGAVILAEHCRWPHEAEIKTDFTGESGQAHTYRTIKANLQEKLKNQ